MTPETRRPDPEPLTWGQWQDAITLAGKDPAKLTATERARVEFYRVHLAERERIAP